jgi:phage terminase large subunit
VFSPLLKPARYKGAHGGRGSGKSTFFAELVIDHCLDGESVVCVRELQRTLMQSSKRLIESRIQALNVGSLFRIMHDRIEGPHGSVIIFQGMQDHTAESIKSLEGFDVAWIEEAQSLSSRSLSLLRPTIRAQDSEIWASWNPTRKSDAVDEFFRAKKPANAIVVEANWRDNPWWTDTLEAERKLELKLYPDRYGHTYEGDYAKAFEGAYFASGLAQAKSEDRIGHVAADPLLPLRAFIDIGGAGSKADAFVIWIVQWVAQEIRVLDYYEAVGQVLAEHVEWLRERGYDKAIIHLPHDGINANNVTGKRYVEHFEDAGFRCEQPMPNQGSGAARLRIEAVRRLLPKCWFNADTTEHGRYALGFYHERKDVERGVGLGPDHDWSSHAADAFGLMCVAYQEPSRMRDFGRKLQYRQVGIV